MPNPDVFHRRSAPLFPYKAEHFMHRPMVTDIRVAAKDPKLHSRKQNHSAAIRVNIE
jgi:hypothetical protein